jgi:hypothetical protein
MSIPWHPFTDDCGCWMCEDTREHEGRETLAEAEQRKHLANALLSPCTCPDDAGHHSTHCPVMRGTAS